MADSVDLLTGQVTLADGAKIYYEIRSPKLESIPKENLRKVIFINGALATLKNFEEEATNVTKAFSKSPTPLQFLTFDSRGIGKSGPSTLVRQTSSMLAEDTLALINQVWGENAKVDVIGVSLGGMIAQELAWRLVQAKRLRSLYLLVTSRGNYIRPFAMLPVSLTYTLIPSIFNPDREKMMRNLAPELFSPTSLKDHAEPIIQMWLSDLDAWFAFNDRTACASQAMASRTHYLTNDRVQMIREANVPITVGISTHDKTIPPSEQRELASVLRARTEIFKDQGHVIAGEDAKGQLFDSIINHLRSA